MRRHALVRAMLAVSVLASSLSLLGASTLTSVASAQETPPEFQPLLDRAMQHYTAREYEQAIALFEQAYAIRAEPELVYNIARSYERIARHDDALREYERFVALPGTTAELRGRALSSIQALRAEQESRRAAEQARTTTTTTETTATTSGTGAGSTTTAAQSSGGGSGLATVGWVLLGIGGAAILGGAVTGGIALERNGAFDRATARSEQLSLRDQVKSYALATDILLIGGGVIAITGLVLGLVGSSESSSPRAAGDLRIIPGPGQAGLALDVVF